VNKKAPTLPIYVPCDECGKIFKTTNSRFALSKRHYCCKACYTKAQTTGQKPKIKKSDRISPTLGHKKGKNTRRFCVYTVFDNRTDEVVVVDATAEVAAKAMNIAVNSFYGYVKRIQDGKNNRWYIERTYLEGEKLYV